MDKNNNDLDLLTGLLNKPSEDGIKEVDASEVTKFLNDDAAKDLNVVTSIQYNNEYDESDLPDFIKTPNNDTNKLSTTGAKDFGETDTTPITAKESKKVEIEEEETSSIGEDSNVDDLGEYESDVAEFFVDKFTKELGWELGEEERPKDIKGVIDMITKVVEENSRPQYPDEKVGRLAEFVANGGKFEEFYESTVVGRVPLDSVDLEKETHQMSILREDLKNKGFKDIQIERKLKRWEDAGVLYDEAEEALESVKEYRKDLEQTLLDRQKNERLESQQQQQKFFANVDKTIKDLNNVRGISISEKDKKELLEYIFKPGSDGYTGYYKDSGLIVNYNSNPRSLLESAYFTKKGDALVKAIERKVESAAAKNLKQKLSSSKEARGVNQGSNDKSGQFSTFASLGSVLLPRG